jgi:hypothetical protein
MNNENKIECISTESEKIQVLSDEINETCLAIFCLRLSMIKTEQKIVQLYASGDKFEGDSIQKELNWEIELLAKFESDLQRMGATYIEPSAEALQKSIVENDAAILLETEEKRMKAIEEENQRVAEAAETINVNRNISVLRKRHKDEISKVLNETRDNLIETYGGEVFATTFDEWCENQTF